MLREAEKTDAAELIAFLNQVGSESDYMTLDEAGILMNQEEMASFIEHQTASSNQLYLLALLMVRLPVLSASQLISTSEFAILVKSLSW